MNKKGAWEWENIGKLLIAIALLVVLLAIILALKGKDIALLERIKEILTFGG